jgi:hypothetical protein
VNIIGRAEPGQWVRATTEYEKVMAKAATLGMRQIGKLAESKARAAVAAAGFTTNVQRTIRALNKPPSGYVLNPAIWLHSTVNYLDVFESGRTITGTEFLWLPLPNVPPNTGSGTKFGGLISRPHMTPSQYIRKVGPLVFMKDARGKGLPMLGAVVEGPETKPSRGRLRKTFLKQHFGEKTRPTHIVPMFYAIKAISIPPKFDTEKAVANAMEGLEDAYHEIIKPDEDRLSGN